MECPVRWFRDCLSGPHLLVPFLSCGFDAGRGHSYFCFFFLASSGFFLISPRLDFSFYNVVIPELCFLFYNNRGHYTGLILVCIPFSVFKYFKLLPRAQGPSGERPEALTQEENGLSYGQQTLTVSVLLVLEEKRKRSEFQKTMDKC